MVQDIITSTYQSDMRLYRDRPDILTRGAWRKCLPGAKPLPFPHRFTSSTLDPDHWRIFEGVGEVPGKKGASRRQTNPRLKGQTFCGTEYDLRNGSLYSQRGTPEVDEEGIPFCCESGPPLPGGLVCWGVSSFAGPEGGVEDVAGGGVDELPAVAGAEDLVAAGTDELPAVAGAEDVAGAGVSDPDALDGAEDVAGGGVDELPAVAGAEDVVSAIVDGPPVFSLLRSGVRCTVWTGRNASPTALLRSGVRCTVWTGRNASPTALLRSGVRCTVWTGRSEEPTAELRSGVRGVSL